MRGLHLASMDGERNRLLAFVDNAVVRTVNVGGFADGLFSIALTPAKPVSLTISVYYSHSSKQRTDCGVVQVQV